MIIPAAAPHKANAERLMDFYYDPEVAARLAAYVQYVCPVAGAQEAMVRIDPAMADDPWIFPPPEVIDGAFVTAALTSARAELLDRRFDSVVSG
jgi:spermidine/putrescine transport system substrate-binding protein